MNHTVCRRGLDTTQNKGRNGFLSQPCGGPGNKTGVKDEGREMHEEANASLNLAEKELICSKGEQKVSMAFNPPRTFHFRKEKCVDFWTLWGTLHHFSPSVRAYTPTQGDFQSPGLLPFRGKLSPSLPFSPLHLCAPPRWEPLSPLPSVNHSH